MANKFDQYGLKEVANVTFYALDDDEEKGIEAGQPVLYLDTLKVSNIETTAEDTSAQGGWGNPKLITWEYNKEVNVTLEDALFSPASLEVMMGANLIESATGTPVSVQVTEEVKATADDSLTITNDGTNVYALVDGAYVKATTVTSKVAAIEGVESGKTYRVFYTASIATEGKANKIEISASKFGGTYKIVGDTLVKNLDGKEEAFQFVIGKAKINSDVSFEMSADGDPATFSMPITAMKDKDGNMFSLIKYEL